MNENEAGLPPKPARGLPAGRGGRLWISTCLCLLGIIYGSLAAILASSVASSLRFLARVPLESPTRYLVVDSTVSLASFAASLLVTGLFALVLARQGYRWGHRQPNSRQFAGAAAVTAFWSCPGILAAIHSRQWSLLPVYLINPLSFLAFFLVIFRAVTKAPRVGMVGTGSLAAEAPPTAATETGGHWWTRYRTEQQEGETQATNGRGSRR